MIYILFIIIYPFENDQTIFIFLGFILGFCIDFFTLSGGANTISTLTISALRPTIIKSAFGITSEIPKSFQSDKRTINKFIFLILIILIHHLLYFVIIYFNWSGFYLIIKNTLLTSVFSLILIALISPFYKKLNDS